MIHSQFFPGGIQYQLTNNINSKILNSENRHITKQHGSTKEEAQTTNQAQDVLVKTVHGDT